MQSAAQAREASNAKPGSSVRDESSESAVPSNPIWQSLATHASGRPRVGRPDDPLEREADVVADRVLHGSPPANGWTRLSLASPTIQRACRACEDEPTIQREAEPGEPSGSATLAATLASRRGRGQPLDPSVREFFEPRFGADLSSVRTHTDGEAQQTAAQLRARAFTWGDDVYFGRGAHAPDSHAGRRLLAHELTHVLQQRGGRATAIQPWIQREPEFRVLDEVEPDRRRSSDANRIYFDFDSAEIEASQATALTELIERLRASAPETITLTGMASEEGRAGHNRGLVARRLAAVERRLRDAGFTNIVRNPISLTDAAGQIEYRRQRFVQVDTTQTVGSECGAASRAATEATDRGQCESAFAGAWPRAQAICSAALEALRAPSDTTATDAQTRLGVGSTREVIDLIQQVQAVLGRMGPSVTSFDAGQGHICRSRCDAECSTTASGSADGISLCHSFYDDNEVSGDLRPWVLIHEAAHGTGEFSDIQYHHQRGFALLEAGERRFNADSITRVIVELGDADRRVWTARRQAPAVALPTGLSSGDHSRMVGAFGELQMALVLSAFDQTFYYEYVREAQAARGWPCVDGLAHQGNKRIAGAAIRGRFEMIGVPAAALDPSCTSAVSPGPGANDHARMAAIVDRLERMSDIVGDDITVTQSGVGGPSWRRDGGNWIVDVPSDYPGGRSTNEVARELLRALIAALPNIETRFVADFEHIVFAAASSRTAASTTRMDARRSQRRADNPNWGRLPPPANGTAGSNTDAGP